MRLLLPLVRPLGMAARMTADQNAELNIEINEIAAAIAPVLDRVTCPVRYVLPQVPASGSNQEEMEQMRAALDLVLARNPNLTVSAGAVGGVPIGDPPPEHHLAGTARSHGVP